MALHKKNYILEVCNYITNKDEVLCSYMEMISNVHNFLPVRWMWPAFHDIEAYRAVRLEWHIVIINKVI